jgi:hypothetical protein
MQTKRRIPQRAPRRDGFAVVRGRGRTAERRGVRGKMFEEKAFMETPGFLLV